ncbi:class I SAM-dependent methyltransferase [Propylenella binzhouense]|uniref:class I SAM-dependent methyltransferase n=1 Tax=Propylenella binzhouense TaxID=2555902 RepID=UPI0031B5A047
MSDSAAAIIHDSDTWDATAADYEALAEPFTRQYAEKALELAGGVRPGERVLDVAAGTGALTLAAARAGARVLATDFSPGMVARLRQRLESEGMDRAGCEARVMDGQALELPDGGFDAAFSVFGVMLFPDHRKGLAELARVLRPGGRAAVAVWTRKEGAGPALVLVDAFRSAFPDRDAPSFPAPGMRRLMHADALVEDMREAGLREVTVTTVTGAWTAPSADWVADNADRLYRQFPLYAALGEGERRQVREAIRERLARTSAGEVRIESDAHVGVGHR